MNASTPALRQRRWFIALLVLAPALLCAAENVPAKKGKRGFQTTGAGMQPVTERFTPTADELNAALHATPPGDEPLSFPRGNGLRILMTGHSWVAPAARTLPAIAKAAGFSDHHQRLHGAGGASGSANAIWLSEFGKFRGQPAKTILLPAIATGAWDVMTYGTFYNDKPEVYTQWIDVCLRHNPSMVFYIQDGWPLFRGELVDAPAAKAVPAIEAQSADFQKDLMAGLYMLNSKYSGRVHIIPAGPAVVTMIRHYYAHELPGFDCVSEHLGGTRGIYRDGGHLSDTLAYLLGYAYFGMLYKKSPALITSFQPKDVDPKVDRLMRAAAWDAIITSPYSGLTDKNRNGIADEAEP